MSRNRKKQAKKAAEAQARDLGSRLSDYGHIAADQAKNYGAKAKDVAIDGYEKASPKVEQAWQSAVSATAPRIEGAAGKVAPAVDTARDKVVDDYIPRVQKAMQEAQKASKKKGSAPEKAKKATKAAGKALSEPPKKSKAKRAGKFFGWVAVGTAVAGAGYLVWKRTQPVDDPWAEEYWDNATVTSGGTAGAATGKVKDAADKAKDAASNAAGAVSAKVEDLRDSEAPADEEEDSARDIEVNPDTKPHND